MDTRADSWFGSQENLDDKLIAERSPPSNELETTVYDKAVEENSRKRKLADETYLQTPQSPSVCPQTKRVHSSATLELPPSPLVSLPDHLLIIIISHLNKIDISNVALVCKRLYSILPHCVQFHSRIVKTPLALEIMSKVDRFKKINTISYICHDFSSPLTSFPSSLCSRLLNFRLFFAYRTPCTVIQRHISAMENLVELSFTGSLVNDSLLKQVSVSCPKLRHLSIFNSVSRTRRIYPYIIPTGDATPPGRGISLSPTDVGILYITSSCNRLESLLIGGNNDHTLPRITNKCLEGITKKCPNLCCISFEHTYNINDDIFPVIAKLPGLTSLSLLHTRVSGNTALEYIPKLKRLSLVHIFSSVVNLSLKSLSNIAMLPSIKSVCFSLDNRQISPEAVLPILLSLKPGFVSIGAFPPALDSLKDQPALKHRRLSLLYACDYPGLPARLSWMHCLLHDSRSGSQNETESYNFL